MKLNLKSLSCYSLGFILFPFIAYSQANQHAVQNKFNSTSSNKVKNEQGLYNQNENDIERKINELLSKMTLQEKIGQLNQHAGADKEAEELIKKGEIGSFLGVSGAENVNKLQELAVKKSRLGIPLIFGEDVIHGYHTTFPIPLAEASSWDPELVKEACGIAAIEAASEGINWTFAPMVDIARDPRWGRIAEGSGEDPFLGSAFASAEVKGFQGENLSDKKSIAACAKHYVAYGAAEAGRDYNTVDISERTLREIYLPPFKAAVDAGVATLMSAFNSLNGVPASANYFTLTKILKDEWGFKGFVVSDYNAIGELVNHEIAANKSEAALKAFTAGVDMDMVGDTIEGDIYHPYLAKLVKEGKVQLEQIDESVRRILRIKYELGLFDHPYVDKSYFEKNMPSQKYRDSIALRLSEESLVLLKNENKILPLKRNIKSIAVIGPLADDHKDPLGPWACAPDSNNVVTVLNGIKNLVSKDTKINFAKGCEINDTDESNFEDAIRIAKQSDVAVLVVGESSDMSGEASSRADIDVPGMQQELVKRIYEAGVPVIVILMNGRPLTINWISQNANAIIESWFLGDQAGNAIANVLFGYYNPSGKLPVTFPRSVGQIPIYYNHLNTGRPPENDNRYTSKYLDLPVTPLYPFGFGLSYTNFSYSDLKIDKNEISDKDSLIVTAKITNSGNTAGDEIVQLYTHDHYADVSPPVKELKGFKRVYLNPGESKLVKFIIKPAMLAFYNIKMKKVIEPGVYDVMVGKNSDDYLTTSFEIKN